MRDEAEIGLSWGPRDIIPVVSSPSSTETGLLFVFHPPFVNVCLARAGIPTRRRVENFRVKPVSGRVSRVIEDRIVISWRMSRIVIKKNYASIRMSIQFVQLVIFFNFEWILDFYYFLQIYYNIVLIIFLIQIQFKSFWK